jgi:2-keto-4-pentenoate hydratase/2-oxohepta-3-ene-1,7-dioic acid hydratase in catechol pathway
VAASFLSKKGGKCRAPQPCHASGLDGADMKLIRFQHRNRIAYGRLDGETVRVCRTSPFDDSDGATISFKPDALSLSDVRLLAPCQPSKIVCLGLNYHHHAQELRMQLPEIPLLFLKPPSAVIGPYDKIVLPPHAQRIDYEGELGVVIGKRASNVSEDEFGSYVLGYTCFNDVTDRIAQAKDGQWTRAKSYDTFAPIGPWIETEVAPHNLKLETRVNNKTVQSGNTSDLIFSVPVLVSFISSVMTLMPGDVIASGTPEGIGPLRTGDLVEVTIEGIGTLANSVIAHDEVR